MRLCPHGATRRSSLPFTSIQVPVLHSPWGLHVFTIRPDRTGAIREKQTRPFQPPFSNTQAMLQITMVILIGFRMHNDGKIDARTAHAL